MGVAPEFLPGQARFENEAARDRFAKAWGADLPPVASHPGLVEILKRCRNGQIKALYVIGENPLATLPASLEVKEALAGLELLICQDPFLTETAQLAHIVLPASTYAEKDGTFTNLEGRVLRIRRTMDPVGESFPDWHIMTAVASGLGFPFEYESPQDIQNEIMKLLPGYYNLGQPRKMAPKADAYLAHGYVSEVKSRYQTDRKTTGKGQFSLSLGQLLSHSGKLSTHAAGLMKICPNSGRLQMNVQDMERMGLSDGGRVRVSTEKGSLEMGTESNPALLPGACFFPEHFNEPPVKDLMPVEIDATTGVPSFKLAQVTVEKI